MTDYKTFLAKLNNNLNTLREREAKYAGNTPLDLLNQITDHEQAIALTKQVLRDELTEAEWREALRPLLVAIETRTGESASSVTIGDVEDGIHGSIIAGGDVVSQTVINVVNLLGRYVSDRGQELERETGPAGVELAQSILDLVLNQVSVEDPRTARKYPENPAGYQTPLSDTLTELLKKDRELVTQLQDLLIRYEAVVSSQNRTIDMGGGTYVEGDIDIEEGDFTGRDKIVQGNNSITYILNQYLGQNRHKPDTPALHQQIHNYLTWLQDRTGTIELRGIKREGQQVVQLPLSEVYVPLQAKSFQASQSSSIEKSEAEKNEIKMNEILGMGRRIVITGGPGSGKTTVLLHIAWTIAVAIAADNPGLAYRNVGLRDTVLEELKAILNEAHQLVQIEDWFRDYSLLGRLKLDAACEKTKQLAQVVGPNDPLQRWVTKAQKELRKLRPVVENAHQVDAAAQLTYKLEEAEKAVEELKASSRKTEKLEQAQEEVKRLTFEMREAWKETNVFRADRERAEGLSIEAQLDRVSNEEIRREWAHTERLVSEMSAEAEQIKIAITKARKLTLEKKTSLPLPIFIPLSAYAAHLRRLSTTPDLHDTTLATFISRYLIEKQSSFDLTDDFFRQILCQGRAVILLLDGLDEVPDEAERVRVREAIEELLTGRPAMWVVVTCRSAAYQGRTALGKGFQEVQVCPLKSHHVEAMIRQAYAHLYKHDTLAQSKADELLQGIERMEAERRQRVDKKVDSLDLVSSPLLVRMVLVVHFSERHLPEQRAELYMQATDAMLLPEYAPDEVVADRIGRLVGGSREIHRELVQHLAFAMHRQGQQQGGRISENELRQILNKDPAYAPLVDDFIALTRLRGTLLEEHLGMYNFIHLAFQEYLAARYLAEIVRSEKEIAEFFLKKEDDTDKERILDIWWREPALLVIGYLSVTSPQTVRRFLRHLTGLDQTSIEGKTDLPIEVQLAAAEVAVAAIQGWMRQDDELHNSLSKQLATFLVRPDWSPSNRTAAGDILAQLGDTRPGVGIRSDGLPDIAWCSVRAGRFTMGSRSIDCHVRDGETLQRTITSKLPDGTTQERLLHAFDDETPQWVVDDLSTYRISRFPITNAQYAAFVQDNGYSEKWRPCWTEAGWTWKGDRAGPETYGEAFDFPNHPVVGVNWYEAVAFCGWLTNRLREINEINPDETVMLPSEKQWEKAVRGTDGRHYPWGDEVDSNRANYMDAGIGNTSVVGCFPGGASPYGCEEMSGNVWEWCRTKWEENYQTYQDDNDVEGDEIRVLRGGSFTSYWISVRCSVRGWAYPHVRDKEVGFRVVIIRG